jgi:hypothetical protein
VDWTNEASKIADMIPLPISILNDAMRSVAVITSLSGAGCAAAVFA